MSAIDPRELNRLHQQARHRAQELRSAAIGDFWRGGDAAWETTLASARRSAERLARRLARHRDSGRSGLEG